MTIEKNPEIAISYNVSVFATSLNRTRLTLPSGGATLPVKGCGALIFLRYGNGLSFTDLAPAPLRKHSVLRCHELEPHRPAKCLNKISHDKLFASF